jgi:2'-5' RNA ligase
MSDRIRTFVAIDFPAVPMRVVVDDLAGLGRSVKVAAEPFHLTLKFLGDTDRNTVDHIVRTIADVAQQHTSFDVELARVDAFPRRERPSVIWVGLSPIEPLIELAGDLESRLEPIGFPRESRPFQPHVTIARIKGRPPRELADLFELYGTETFGTETVRQIHLYQSELRPQGPEYTVLSTVSLKPLEPDSTKG